MSNVVLLGTVTVGVTVLSKVSQNKDFHKPILGGVLYVGLLALVDMASPALATGLATVVLVTALLLNGVPLFSAITRKVT